MQVVPQTLQHEADGGPPQGIAAYDGRGLGSPAEFDRVRAHMSHPTFGVTGQEFVEYWMRGNVAEQPADRKPNGTCKI